MKLWVDDCRPKPEGFDVHAKNAKEAIEHLENGRVTDVSLDHDLASVANDASGYFIAKWIEVEACMGRLPRLAWAIHSANPVGRHYMEMALQNADHYWDEHERRKQNGQGQALS